MGKSYAYWDAKGVRDVVPQIIYAAQATHERNPSQKLDSPSAELAPPVCTCAIHRRGRHGVHRRGVRSRGGCKGPRCRALHGLIVVNNVSTGRHCCIPFDERSQSRTDGVYEPNRGAPELTAPTRRPAMYSTVSRPGWNSSCRRVRMRRVVQVEQLLQQVLRHRAGGRGALPSLPCPHRWQHEPCSRAPQIEHQAARSSGWASEGDDSGGEVMRQDTSVRREGSPSYDSERARASIQRRSSSARPVRCRRLCCRMMTRAQGRRELAARGEREAMHGPERTSRRAGSCSASGNTTASSARETASSAAATSRSRCRPSSSPLSSH